MNDTDPRNRHVSDGIARTSGSQTILSRQRLMDELGIKGDLLRSLIAQGMPRIRISTRVDAYIKEEVVDWLKERNGPSAREASPGEPATALGAEPARKLARRPGRRAGVGRGS